MRLTLFAAALLCLASSALARHTPIDWTLQSTEAVAFVRVTSVTEELDGELVKRRATLGVVGHCFGLKDENSVEVAFGVASPVGTMIIEADSPDFHVGEHCIVLLKFADSRWSVLREIYLTDDGQIEEEGAFDSVGIDHGTDANLAVDKFKDRILKLRKDRLPPEH